MSLAGLLLSACTRPSLRAVAGFFRPRPRSVQVLIENRPDLNPQVADQYDAIYENQIVPDLRAGDDLMVAPINQYSCVPSIVSVNFPPASWLFGQTGYSVKQEVVTAKKDAAGVLAHLPAPSGSGTEIVCSIFQAAQRLSSSHGRKVLIVISSGFEQSDLFNLDNYNLWYAADGGLEPMPQVVNGLIARVRAANEFPSLHGATACFTGLSPGSPDSTGQRPPQGVILGVRDFWTALLTEAGARVSYGALAACL